MNANLKKAAEMLKNDDALAEACGIPVRLLPCSYGNIKITTPEDVVMAELMLKNRENR